MTRRRALFVFAAAAALLVALNALVWSLYRSEVRTVNNALTDRLNALGHTSATWLATGGDTAPFTSALVAENHLEDAYVIDSGLHVVAGAHTPAGAPLNLLRVDQDRLTAALDGRSSIGVGYSIANAEVEAAYFSFERGHDRYVLTLEAGAEYHAPASRLRTTYFIAVALSVLVAGVFGLGLVLALRSLERARVAHGRAERLAAVGQMAAMIAHEVRNPLGILRGQVELARERLAADAPPREHERFAEMLAEIERLNRLTEEFLGLARDQPLDTAPVELGALATALADDVRVATPTAKLEIHAASVEVEGDAGKLRQALHNLVLNALQIGGDTVTIRIDVSADASGATIRVSDDGPGIPADLAPRLFDPFVSKRAGGSGLGLAIARRVAERHGGSLELVSTPGQPGAAFSIYLPRHP